MKAKILYYTFHYLISTLLILSGSLKIVDPEALISTLKILNFFPDIIIIAISVLLPVIEVLTGILLFMKLKTDVILLAAAFLFLVFLLFSIYGAAAGIDSECGCFGPVLESDFGLMMILRNFALFIIVTSLYFFHRHHAEI